MEPTPSPNERELADLAALADGSLAPERRSEVEARVAADPDLRALVDEQRRAVDLMRSAAADARAPLALRERPLHEVAPAAAR